MTDTPGTKTAFCRPPGGVLGVGHIGIHLQHRKSALADADV